MEKVKHTISHVADASTSTSVGTSPYFFSGIGVESLFATNATIGQSSPTVTVGSTLTSVGSASVIKAVQVTNGTTTCLELVVSVTPTAGTATCVVSFVIPDRSSPHTNTYDFSGVVQGYIGSTVLDGTVLYADTSSNELLMTFTSVNTSPHILQAMIYYEMN